MLNYVNYVELRKQDNGATRERFENHKGASKVTREHSSGRDTEAEVCPPPLGTQPRGELVSLLNCKGKITTANGCGNQTFIMV